MGKRILYFHTGGSTFVDKDIRILEEVGSVSCFSFTVEHKRQTPWLLVRQFLFLIRHFLSARLYVCQFAGYHSLLPALFAKVNGSRCLIISGGTDCHDFPGIRYGNLQKKTLGRFTKWSFLLCDHIALKHETLWDSTYDYDSNEPVRQGIRSKLPLIKTAHSSIPNGYDHTQWSFDPLHRRKQNSFITVTGGLQFPFQRQLKGIDLILHAAPFFPKCEFTIIGVPHYQQWENIPENVRLLPPCKQDQIRNEFSNSAFYLQLSMAEGFPNALCEAMLSGCVPIGSSVFSIPEIIGANGYLLSHRNPDELKTVLRNALDNYDPILGEKAAESIRSRFPLERRRNELQSLCRKLMD